MPLPAEHPDREAELRARRHRVEVLIYACWGLIFVKCVGIVWVVQRYDIPFSPMWIVGPTVAFGALATTLYYVRH